MKNFTMSKKSTIFICILLCIVLIGISVMIVFQKSTGTFNKVAIEREISLNKENVDVQSMMDSFDNVITSQDEETLVFEGTKKIDASLLEELDNLSETQVEDLSDVSVRYHFTYNSDSNIVTLSAEMKMPDGEVSVDTIEGVGFINKNNEIDAVMNVEGEGILLSEMQNAGMIENCGWFSKLIKKIAMIVVIAAIAVAAVVVVVATAGAAAPAIVAAGIGVTTTVVTTAAVTATAIAGYATLTAAIAAGVYITAAMVENIDFQGVRYKMENFSKVAAQLVRGFYYLALATTDGAMLVSPLRLPTAIAAAAAMSASLSVYTPDYAEAETAAFLAGGAINPPIMEVDQNKPGYFWHCHNWNRMPKYSHAFLGLPV